MGYYESDRRGEGVNVWDDHAYFSQDRAYDRSVKYKDDLAGDLRVIVHIISIDNNFYALIKLLTCMVLETNYIPIISYIYKCANNYCVPSIILEINYNKLLFTIKISMTSEKNTHI